MVAMITCREDIPNLYKDQLKKWTKTGEVYCARISACGTPFENVAKRDTNHHMSDNVHRRGQVLHYNIFFAIT